MRKILQYALKFLSIAILQKYKPKIVAITGSAGKTSAKEAIFCVLNSAHPARVGCNAKNLNTEIGAPLAIIRGIDAKRNIWLWFKNILDGLRLILIQDKSYPDILVLELAADRPGDIGYLTSFIHPDVAVVTTIGEMPVHLEFFPNRSSYIAEKTNIIKNLKPGGVAILNYDDLAVREMKNIVPTSRRRNYYGFEAGAEVRILETEYILPASSSELAGAGVKCKIQVAGQSEAADFKIKKAIGMPAVYAAAAAMAVGLEFNIKLPKISLALEEFAPPAHRLEIKAGVKDTIIIDDSYNSSPLAAEAALEVLAKFKKHRRVAVLGSMRELGFNTEAAHRLIGRQAVKASDIIFLVGPEMVFAQEEATKFGLKLGQDLFWFETSPEAAKPVEAALKPGDVVLIKGSLSVNMKAIVEEITVV